MLVMFVLANGAYALSPLAPLFSFEMAAHHDIYLEGNTTTISLITLHQSSSNWLLYIRHNDIDVGQYDNISVSIKCNNAANPTVFQTTSYPDWVNNGSISINFNYQNENYPIFFNSIEFTSKYSACDISMSSISFDGNGAYDTVTVEMIPQLGVLEFINCEGLSSPQIGVAQEGLTFVQIMTDVWSMAWNVYSIMIIIVALFGIPILAFMLIRWAVWKTMGIKIGQGSGEKR
jgi:hypothetical protein